MEMDETTIEDDFKLLKDVYLAFTANNWEEELKKYSKSHLERNIDFLETFIKKLTEIKLIFQKNYGQ